MASSFSSSRYSLGIDMSTQSVTAVVIDIDTRTQVLHKSINYKALPTTENTGIMEDFLLPPREEGDASQPVKLFLIALDAILSEVARTLAQDSKSISSVVCINVSGQQHAHVWLGKDCEVMQNRFQVI